MRSKKYQFISAGNRECCRTKNVAIFINYRTPNPKFKFSHPSTLVFCTYGSQWNYIIGIYALCTERAFQGRTEKIKRRAFSELSKY